jgi:hypothetical protein
MDDTVATSGKDWRAGIYSVVDSLQTAAGQDLSHSKALTPTCNEGHYVVHHNHGLVRGSRMRMAHEQVFVPGEFWWQKSKKHAAPGT